MRFALLNSSLGLLVAASELHKLRPDADLIIAMDPDCMPWGPRTPEAIAERSLTIARAAASYEPDVIVMACNTGSVHALGALRAEFEPRIPVVGTVPAIKPAAAVTNSVAIWATVATTASDYQRRLIEQFGGGAEVTPVACPGLATAIDAGNPKATAAAIADAAGRTPSGCGAGHGVHRIRARLRPDQRGYAGRCPVRLGCRGRGAGAAPGRAGAAPVMR